MLLQILASTALAVPSALPDEDHGKLPWFDGSFNELIAKATAEEKLIFLDFWADW